MLTPDINDTKPSVSPSDFFYKVETSAL